MPEGDPTAHVVGLRLRLRVVPRSVDVALPVDDDVSQTADPAGDHGLGKRHRNVERPALGRRLVRQHHETGEFEQGGHVGVGYVGHVEDDRISDTKLVGEFFAAAPAKQTRNESDRAQQIFETLVSLEPGTTEFVPGLAEHWEVSDDGLTYTFQIREGVTFHDGEALNAEAVCFNFDRWYNFKGSFQNPAASYYWQTVFGGVTSAGPLLFQMRGADLLLGGGGEGVEHVVVRRTARDV